MGMVIVAATFFETSTKHQVLYIIYSCLPTTHNIGVMVCILQVKILRLIGVNFLVTCLVSQQSKGMVECVPQSPMGVLVPPLALKSLIDLGQTMRLL